MTEDAIQAVFGESEVIAAGCPRCGARYVLTLEALEAYRRDRSS